MKPETSVKSTVTCLRSPSIALREFRILSARCFGVYDCGEAKRPSEAAGAVARDGGEAAGAAGVSDAPHSPQNLLAGVLTARHAGQTAAS